MKGWRRGGERVAARLKCREKAELKREKNKFFLMVV
jgi:hypothetical protein